MCLWVVKYSASVWQHRSLQWMWGTGSRALQGSEGDRRYRLGALQWGEDQAALRKVEVGSGERRVGYYSPVKWRRSAAHTGLQKTW